MRKVFQSLLCIACAVMAGCHPEKPAPKQEPAAHTGAPLVSQAPHVMDIGDVEAGIWITVTVDESSRGSTVVVEDQHSRRDRLVLSNAEVTAMPESLKAAVQINADSSVLYAERVVLVRGALLVEQQVAARFAVFFGKNAPDIAATEALFTEAAFSAEIRDVVLAAGASALVHVEAEAMLLPEGANLNAADLSQLTVDPKDMTRILSNPLRVNQKTAGDVS